jgi:hypothetical protein
MAKKHIGVGIWVRISDPSLVLRLSSTTPKDAILIFERVRDALLQPGFHNIAREELERGTLCQVVSFRPIEGEWLYGVVPEGSLQMFFVHEAGIERATRFGTEEGMLRLEELPMKREHMSAFTFLDKVRIVRPEYCYGKGVCLDRWQLIVDNLIMPGYFANQQQRPLLNEVCEVINKHSFYFGMIYAVVRVGGDMQMFFMHPEGLTPERREKMERALKSYDLSKVKAYIGEHEIKGFAHLEEGIYRMQHPITEIKVDPHITLEPTETCTFRLRYFSGEELEVPAPDPAEGWKPRIKELFEWPHSFVGIRDHNLNPRHDSGACWWHDFKRRAEKEQAQVLWVQHWTRTLTKDAEKPAYPKTWEWL